MGKYDSIIEYIFFSKYREEMTEVYFEREDLERTANELNISRPKNLGDIIYSYKYRSALPENISKTAKEGMCWRLKNIGTAKYKFVLSDFDWIEPDKLLGTIKIPDATPSIIKKYTASDGQALLAMVRYNRLIDVFLGITCYSLQTHLRTTVLGIGQIETGEVYIGIDQKGHQFIIPVQVKSGNDKLGVSQIEQDIAMCAQKYPNLICRAIACQFVTANIIALFEFQPNEDRAIKMDEKHYRLVDAQEISTTELFTYNRIEIEEKKV